MHIIYSIYFFFQEIAYFIKKRSIFAKKLHILHEGRMNFQNFRLNLSENHSRYS